MYRIQMLQQSRSASLILHMQKAGCSHGVTHLKVCFQNIFSLDRIMLRHSQKKNNVVRVTECTPYDTKCVKEQ